LKEDGIKESGQYATSNKLAGIMKERKLSRGSLALQANVAGATIAVARDSKRIRIGKAEQIAVALQLKTSDVFTLNRKTTGLADRTILHHHRLISAILEKAKRTRIIPYNVASEHATAPKIQRKEAKYLDEDQAQHIVGLLLAEEDIRVKTAILLLLYSGVRRGELCGLEWRDIDFEKQMIHIARASQYQKGSGVTEVPTKNESSERTIKLPAIMFSVLKQYRSWWAAEKLKLGDAWKGEKNRLFVQWDGKPINPDTINFWQNRFIAKHNLPHFTPHSCRHTFSSLQIAAGVDIRTLQARTGHSQASTLVKTYSHVIKSAAEAMC
jgi:integrase